MLKNKATFGQIIPHKGLRSCFLCCLDKRQTKWLVKLVVGQATELFLRTHEFCFYVLHQKWIVEIFFKSLVLEMAWDISSACSDPWHDYHCFIVLQPKLSPLPWNIISLTLNSQIFTSQPPNFRSRNRNFKLTYHKLQVEATDDTMITFYRWTRQPQPYWGKREMGYTSFYKLRSGKHEIWQWRSEIIITYLEPFCPCSHFYGNILYSFSLL